MTVFWALWPVPLIALAIWITVQTVAYRRETRSERRSFDEQKVSAVLGYRIRPDHPWVLKQARRPILDQTAARSELMFDDANRTR